MFYFDPLYLLFIGPPLLLSVLATLLVRYWNNKYSQKPNTKQFTGYDVVEKAAPYYNLQLDIKLSENYLGDSFNPSTKELTLSKENATRPTVSSVAITAHELGHAIQHKEKSLLLTVRTLLVPTVNIGTNLGYILILIGLFLSFVNLAWIGIALFSLSTIFSFLTIPIELDASKKALKIIRELNLLESYEVSGAKKVLASASLTYVAAAIASLANLMYFVFRISSSSRND